MNDGNEFFDGSSYIVEQAQMQGGWFALNAMSRKNLKRKQKEVNGIETNEWWCYMYWDLITRYLALSDKTASAQWIMDVWIAGEVSDENLRSKTDTMEMREKGERMTRTDGRTPS